MPPGSRTPSRSSSDHAELREDLGALVNRARELAVGEYETDSIGELHLTLLPRALSLLTDAESLFSEIVAAFDSPQDTSSHTDGDMEGFLEAVDQLVTDGPGARVGDLAFMARLELASRRERLVQLGGSACPPWGLLDACSGARRRVIKAATALGQGLARLSNASAAPDDGFVTEIAVSLTTRRIYARFRRAVDRTSADASLDVRRRLRLAGVQLVVLFNRPIYEELRIVDRREFRRLQSDILAWLRNPAEDERAGEKIWQDLAAFAQMLQEVNRRAELLQHDLAVTGELLDELAHHDDARPRWAEIDRLAHGLRGRDDAFDDLVASKGPRDLGAWRQTLRRVMQSLEHECPDVAPRDVLGDVSTLVIRIDGKERTN